MRIPTSLPPPRASVASEIEPVSSSKPELESPGLSPSHPSLPSSPKSSVSGNRLPPDAPPAIDAPDHPVVVSADDDPAMPRILPVSEIQPAPQTSEISEIQPAPQISALPQALNVSQPAAMPYDPDLSKVWQNFTQRYACYWPSIRWDAYHLDGPTLFQEINNASLDQGLAPNQPTIITELKNHLQAILDEIARIRQPGAEGTQTAFSHCSEEQKKSINDIEKSIKSAISQIDLINDPKTHGASKLSRIFMGVVTTLISAFNLFTNFTTPGNQLYGSFVVTSYIRNFVILQSLLTHPQLTYEQFWDHIVDRHMVYALPALTYFPFSVAALSGKDQAWSHKLGPGLGLAMVSSLIFGFGMHAMDKLRGHEKSGIQEGLETLIYQPSLKIIELLQKCCGGNLPAASSEDPDAAIASESSGTGPRAPEPTISGPAIGRATRSPSGSLSASQSAPESLTSDNPAETHPETIAALKALLQSRKAEIINHISKISDIINAKITAAPEEGEAMHWSGNKYDIGNVPNYNVTKLKKAFGEIIEFLYEDILSPPADNPAGESTSVNDRLIRNDIPPYRADIINQGTVLSVLAGSVALLSIAFVVSASDWIGLADFLPDLFISMGPTIKGYKEDEINNKRAYNEAVREHIAEQTAHVDAGGTDYPNFVAPKPTHSRTYQAYQDYGATTTAAVIGPMWMNLIPSYAEANPGGVTINPKGVLASGIRLVPLVANTAIMTSLTAFLPEGGVIGAASAGVQHVTAFAQSGANLLRSARSRIGSINRQEPPTAPGEAGALEIPAREGPVFSPLDETEAANSSSQEQSNAA